MTSFDTRRQASFWLFAMGVAALAAILGAYSLPGRWLHYVGKPLATLCALVLVLGCRDSPPRYRRALAIGLAFSLLGDVLLMLPVDAFAAGLAAFLCAHLAYLVGFSDGVRFGARTFYFFGYAAVAAVLSCVLWPGVPAPLHGPVLVYTAALAAMAAQAATRAGVLGTPAARLAALGGLVFVISDASLAINRFRWPFAAADAVVLASYWIAQGLIAFSVVRAAASPARA